MNKVLLFIFMSFFLLGCTFNVSMAHTSGTASDVIDDTATNTTDVRPRISVPLSPLTK